MSVVACLLKLIYNVEIYIYVIDVYEMRPVCRDTCRRTSSELLCMYQCKYHISDEIHLNKRYNLNWCVSLCPLVRMSPLCPRRCTAQ